MAQAAIQYHFESIDDHATMGKLSMETSRPVHITQWNDSSLPRFWIDALCINQSDIIERNKQVERMSHIYRHTNLLFVWGLNHQQPKISEDSSESAFRYIEVLCRKLKDLPTTNDDITNSMRRLFTTQENMVSVPAIMEIVRVFMLAWFYRAWVFQEVALSASKPSELWMGFKHISLARLLVAGTVAMEVSAELEPGNALVSTICGLKANRILLALGLDEILIKLGQDSLHLVHPTSNVSICRRLIYILGAGTIECKVTDPRDAIYSLYGLLSTNQFPAMLEPDYTKSVSLVYHSISAFLLSHMGIGILGFLLPSLEGMDECPSWVPDFSCLQQYTLCQQYPSAGTTYKHRVIEDHLMIEDGPNQDFTEAHELKQSFSLLRISCPIYWLQRIESIIHIEGYWGYPRRQDGESLNDFKLNRKPLMVAISSGVLSCISRVTQAEMDHAFDIWFEFLKRAASYRLFPYWAELTGIEGVTDGYKDTLDVVAVDRTIRPMVDRILHGGLGITEDVHLVLGRRLASLKKHDRIGFIPSSLETFILRPCDSGYQFITSCWKSDIAELVEIDSLQLGNKELVTII